LIGDGSPAIGLVVALGCGLLIGLERERHKGEGPDRAAPGLRSFAIAALGGALAQAFGTPGLVVAGAVFVAVLVAIAYFKSRSPDPGITTELALFATYLIGVQSVISPAFGAASGVVLAVLLAARARLHRFATELLTEQELHDGLLIAALALVVLPLVPDTPIDALGGIRPRPIALVVLVILLLQAAGHVALRWLGPRRGVAVAAFASGFVSSTATIATLGRRAREPGAPVALLAAGATWSTAATWVQVLVMAAAISPAAAQRLAPSAAAGALVAALAGALWWSRAARAGAEAAPAPDTRALRPREALAVAALLTLVTVVVGIAQQRFGNAGVIASAALAGLADAQSPVASFAALYAAGQLDAAVLRAGVLAAVASNTLVRIGVAFASGGGGYGVRLATSLLAGLGAAALAAGYN
jgi:uncharacterized membrane protein (DUF4010 family)